MAGNWYSQMIRDVNDKIKRQYITPIQIQHDDEYKSHLSELYTDIQKDLLKNNAPESFVVCIEHYAKAILNAVEYQYTGNVAAAQLEMDQLLDDLLAEDTGVAVSAIKNSISFLDVDDALSGGENDIQFFRARTSDNFIVYDREDMLHIPFDKRYLVSTERFSIPGLPCLYLGTSSYGCWLEIGAPADSCFNVSAIELDNENRILNLTVTSEMLEYCIEKQIAGEDTVLSLFKLWLLTIATSYKVNQDKRSFKSEYVIPQLLMLSCKKKNLYGTAYYSKQLKDDRFANRVSVNLAIIADYHGESKLSSICKRIKLSRSYNYAMFKNLMASLKYRQIYLNVDNSRYIVNIGDFERQVPYRETEFYEFDMYLFAQLEKERQYIDVDEINNR